MKTKTYIRIRCLAGLYVCIRRKKHFIAHGHNSVIVYVALKPASTQSSSCISTWVSDKIMKLDKCFEITFIYNTEDLSSSSGLVWALGTRNGSRRNNKSSAFLDQEKVHRCTEYSNNKKWWPLAGRMTRRRPF